MTYCEGMEEQPQFKCPDCSSRKISDDERRGERSCADCGLVISENMIDPGQDWNDFDGTNDNARAGPAASVLWHDKGLSTDIHWSNKDFSGRAIVGKSRSQMYRMRKWQRRARSATSFDRNMESALIEIARLAAHMSLSKAIKEETAVIYRKALEQDMVRGRSIDTMVAASMYLANQKLQTARSLDDFESNSRATRKSITRAHKIIKAKLRVRIPVSLPEEYVNRYCSLLELPPVIGARTNEILNEARGRELTHGKSPTGVAAAAIYVAARQLNHPRTQRDIADISGVTEVTIRNRYKEIISELGIVLD